MTKDIIRMAKEVGLFVHKEVQPEILAFANLVAEHEREECAKVCEDGINNATDWDSSAWDQACKNRSYAIRARGTT